MGLFAGISLNRFGVTVKSMISLPVSSCCGGGLSLSLVISLGGSLLATDATRWSGGGFYSLAT